MPEQILAGKYIVQEEIARGGMGVIYKALDRSLNRVVAIKMVHAHLSGDSSFVQRFLREARAMARLQHDNIVTIYAVEENLGTPLLVMEYFQGRNLRELTKNRPRLPLREIIRITEQLATALAYAHTHGIIHRDIKPVNVMVDARGKAKLTDFGIAAALDEASITSTGQIIGTPEYMSPEQACGTKLDGRSDLYSVGILLYEMLTGATPYAEDSKTSILGKLAFNKEELTLTFPSDVPWLLQGVVRDLLRRQPEERIQDADTLATQLHEILYTLPQAPLPAEQESEPTVVLPSSLPEAEDRTRPISPEGKTVLAPPRSTEHPYKTGLADAPPSSERQPAPPRSPQGLDETTVLPEQPHAQPEHKRRQPTFFPPPPPAPPSFPFLPLIGGAAILVVVLAGLVYIFANSVGSSPNDSKTVVSKGRDLSPPDQRTEEPQRAEHERTERLRRLEEERKRLSEDQARLEEKQRQADLQRAREEAEQKELASRRDRTAKERELAAQRTRADDERRKALAAERRRVEAEQQRLVKEQEAAEQKPSTSQIAKVLPDAQLQTVLDRFRQAYEHRDLGTLRSLSQMSDSRLRNVEFFFATYETIKASVIDIAATESRATAVLVIDTAITATGETVALDAIAKNNKLTIPREEDGWGKIVW